MSLIIKKIHIKNFRSIRDEVIDANYMTVLVGNNDSGKSNILRALNLFFNGETNPGEKLNFDEDHCFYNNPNKRSKEICISIEFELPENYVDTNGDVLIWKKQWRKGGLYNGDKDYVGYKISKNRLGNEVRKEVEIPKRSNLHSLLTRVDYRYVPAIKDAHFFDLLRSQIYETIAEVAKDSFRESSGSFEDSIGNHLKELTAEIQSSLGIDTRMAFPRDLSHIFERLDFLGGDQSVSLNNRGDGIKVRHIPLILKFIAEKKASLGSRGKGAPTFIWGYEEPENNLEITNCIQLANMFWDYMDDDTAQILLTTHSPVFYNLEEKNTKEEAFVSCHHVSMGDPEKGTKVEHDSRDLDEHMGTMNLIAPKLLEIEREIEERLVVKANADSLAKSNIPTIFVEGASDKIFFERCMSVFFPDEVDSVVFETKDSGAGANYVQDMLLAWHGIKKHDASKPKAAGIVDRDMAGQSARKVVNESNVAKASKCFELQPTENLFGILRSGIQLPITLEEIYPKEIWDYALENEMLCDRGVSKIIPKSMLDELVNSGKTIDSYLEDDWEIWVKRSFKNESKITVSKIIVSKDDVFIRENFEVINVLLRSILTYLGVMARNSDSK